MAKIVVYGDPVLEKKAERVDVFDEELTRFIADMHKTMIKAQGVGLAAPQVGVSKQICIVDLSVGENPDELHILINPEIVEADGAQKGEEGCLSFPEIVTVVERPNHVIVRAQNLAGDPFEIEAEGFLARAFCHEIDHLNGVLFTERVSSLKRNMIKKKVSKRVKAGTWE
ncbi:peptide deformylase [Sulfidibacter corallicola]|uniref:Peptide deformylase n=1 Tax=Sulfidibacter corallicola TaxID=2818388 RepID=A0A8A4TS70_SULCO|nr:peptide deformylase [Sulfidibacter corallicola]QTD52237.1 peptide deformylase [Sulfidibacter corallicola]